MAWHGQGVSCSFCGLLHVVVAPNLLQKAVIDEQTCPIASLVAEMSNVVEERDGSQRGASEQAVTGESRDREGQGLVKEEEGLQAVEELVEENDGSQRVASEQAVTGESGDREGQGLVKEEEGLQAVEELVSVNMEVATAVFQASNKRIDELQDAIVKMRGDGGGAGAVGRAFEYAYAAAMSKIQGELTFAVDAIKQFEEMANAALLESWQSTKDDPAHLEHTQTGVDGAGGGETRGGGGESSDTPTSLPARQPSTSCGVDGVQEDTRSKVDVAVESYASVTWEENIHSRSQPCSSLQHHLTVTPPLSIKVPASPKSEFAGVLLLLFSITSAPHTHSFLPLILILPCIAARNSTSREEMALEQVRDLILGILEKDVGRRMLWTKGKQPVPTRSFMRQELELDAASKAANKAVYSPQERGGRGVTLWGSCDPTNSHLAISTRSARKKNSRLSKARPMSAPAYSGGRQKQAHVKGTEITCDEVSMMKRQMYVGNDIQDSFARPQSARTNDTSPTTGRYKLCGRTMMGHAVGIDRVRGLVDKVDVIREYARYW